VLKADRHATRAYSLQQLAEAVVSSAHMRRGRVHQRNPLAIAKRLTAGARSVSGLPGQMEWDRRDDDSLGGNERGAQEVNAIRATPGPS
jgi:hypothetical protein